MLVPGLHCGWRRGGTGETDDWWRDCYRRGLWKTRRDRSSVSRLSQWSRGGHGLSRQDYYENAEEEKGGRSSPSGRCRRGQSDILLVPFGVVRAEQGHFVREQFRLEYLVLHRRIIQHDLARSSTVSALKSTIPKLPIVSVLRTSSENYHTIPRRLFQVV